MATAAVRCPLCGMFMRVSVQPAEIVKTDKDDQLLVKFDDQLVAHVCRTDR